MSANTATLNEQILQSHYMMCGALIMTAALNGDDDGLLRNIIGRTSHEFLRLSEKHDAYARKLMRAVNEWYAENKEV